MDTNTNEQLQPIPTIFPMWYNINNDITSIGGHLSRHRTKARASEPKEEPEEIEIICPRCDGYGQIHAECGRPKTRCYCGVIIWKPKPCPQCTC